MKIEHTFSGTLSGDFSKFADYIKGIIEEEEKRKEENLRHNCKKYYFFVNNDSVKKELETKLPEGTEIFVTPFVKPEDVMLIDKDSIDYPFGGKELYED